jgi:hypothetical protein
MKRGAKRFLIAISRDVGISAEIAASVRFLGSENLPSAFAVSNFAAAAVASAGAAIVELIAVRFGSVPPVVVSRRLSSL